MKGRYYVQMNKASGYYTSFFFAIILFLFYSKTTFAQNYITTVVGNGLRGNGPDNIAAINAQLQLPASVTFDASDNMFISDTYNHCVRRVDAITGVITTIAGKPGSGGYGGDHVLATNAILNLPTAVAFDSSGNMFIADFGNHCIRRVDAVSKLITTIAGVPGQSNSIYYLDGGDNGPAIKAKFDGPGGIAVDPLGNIYVCDTYDSRIRKITMATGIITTVVGEGASTQYDGVPAINSQAGFPFSIIFDKKGNYYFTLLSSSKICKVDIATGLISTIAGKGVNSGNGGDGGLAINAGVPRPYGIAMDKSGNIYFSDFHENVIRKVDGSTGIITRIVGTGSPGYTGDGGLAISATLNHPYGIGIDSKGVLFIADRDNNVIRKLVICDPNKINGPLKVCANRSINLINTQSGGIWSSSDNSIATVSSDGSVSAKKAGLVDIKYTITNSACGTSNDQVTITVLPVPTVNFGLPQICLPDGRGIFTDSSIIEDGSESMFTYQWNFNDPADPSSSALKNPVHKFINTGPYAINLMVTAGNGCTDSLSKKLVSIYAQPKAGFIASKMSICINEIVQFTDTSKTNDDVATKWHWTFGNNQTSAKQNPSMEFIDSGSQQVYFYFINDKGCNSDTISKKIEVYPYPVLLLDTVMTIDEGANAFITPYYYGAGLNFLWTPSSYLDNVFSMKPKTSTPDDIIYTLTLTGTAGCSVEKSIHVNILKKIIVANAFSPNGDGINDSWIVQGLGNYMNAVVKVYNRNGQVIFNSTGSYVKWDGTHQSKPVPVGTYYYVINPGKGKGLISGSVTVIK